MSWNLPPGVNESMIPGNRPEDTAFEKFHEDIAIAIFRFGLDIEDARLAWNIGLSAINKMKEQKLVVLNREEFEGYMNRSYEEGRESGLEECD